LSSGSEAATVASQGRHQGDTRRPAIASCAAEMKERQATFAVNANAEDIANRKFMT
jgi:hypothetical protein